MKKHFWIPLLGLAILPGLAFADDWKDESGHGRTLHLTRWGDRVPGYWGGHHRYHPRGYWHEPAPRWGGYYAPPTRWRGDWDDDREDWREEQKDRFEDRRERLEDLREERRERYEDWREDREERREDLRKRQRRGYRYWRY